MRALLAKEGVDLRDELISSWTVGEIAETRRALMSSDYRLACIFFYG
eukprot:CAMPEP_0185580382 /NCGR_PEP_ID=MMETSP0434-20130131/16313_1 /TAXON_ID=626734 ORGANISM="Favella taraikaensis, Strain Fe Narragansett Bay" /NCGR_SAMPLE_ID=MMETSP0434 /ASSEMBLY_ACC=CAM_ASM_000379 /LENGTH=46 /DNA_ID= /DNA_START= /DNA_END= /DNA_ORIENTATION=